MSGKTDGLQKPSRLVTMLLDASTREAVVRDVESIGARFRAVTLGSAQLQGQRWTRGDMVQLILSGGTLFGPWELRSYTPFAFDPEAGTMKILAVIHGNGPGSDWFASTQAGARCRFIGPRLALSMPKADRPLVFFGDETSFSTALAVQGARHDARFVFEVDDANESRAVLERFGMKVGATLVAREAGDRHLDTVAPELLDASRSSERIHGVLTGKASSIQRLYKTLKEAGLPGRQLTNIAYWAPGRKGLKGR